MAKYRKVPVVIEAECWQPDCLEQPEPYQPDILGVVWEYGPDGKVAAGRIDTLEGVFRVSIGDWIITGVKGEKYPCKPDIFRETYELVDEG